MLNAKHQVSLLLQPTSPPSVGCYCRQWKINSRVSSVYFSNSPKSWCSSSICFSFQTALSNCSPVAMFCLCYHCFEALCISIFLVPVFFSSYMYCISKIFSLQLVAFTWHSAREFVAWQCIFHCFTSVISCSVVFGTVSCSRPNTFAVLNSYKLQKYSVASEQVMSKASYKCLYI